MDAIMKARAAAGGSCNVSWEIMGAAMPVEHGI
jgi:hypothetical protein